MIIWFCLEHGYAAEWLIENGIDVNVGSVENDSALIMAIGMGEHSKVVSESKNTILSCWFCYV